MTDPLAALRQLVAGMTPGPWRLTDGDVRYATHFIWRSSIWGPKGPGHGALLNASQSVPTEEADANAAAIVAGSRALRLLADEATVEGVARVIDPHAYLQYRTVDGELKVWDIAEGERERASEIARAVLSHLAAQVVKEPQP